MIVTALGLILAVVGLGTVVLTATGSAPLVAPQTEARVGAMSGWVESSEWIAHDHDAADGTAALGPSAQDAAANELAVPGTGFAMPSAMMPGTPDEGFTRLQIELSFLNRATATSELRPAQFSLENSDGDSWLSLLGGTFSAETLAANQFLNTVIAFDIPDESLEPAMYLVWGGDDGEARFLISAEEGHH